MFRVCWAEAAVAAEASEAAESMVGSPAVVEGAAEVVVAEEGEMAATEAAASCFLCFFFLAFDVAVVKPPLEVTPSNSRLWVSQFTSGKSNPIRSGDSRSWSIEESDIFWRSSSFSFAKVFLSSSLMSN